MIGRSRVTVLERDFPLAQSYFFRCFLIPRLSFILLDLFSTSGPALLRSTLLWLTRAQMDALGLIETVFVPKFIQKRFVLFS